MWRFCLVGVLRFRMIGLEETAVDEQLSVLFGVPELERSGVFVLAQY